MAESERHWRRLIVRWTAPKEFTAILLFSILAFLLEYLLVYSFLSNGLTDEFTWVETFQVPYVNWRFTVVVSPMFHLLPISVVIVLVSSWTFLTKHTAFIPHRTEQAKKTVSKRAQAKPRRFRLIRRFLKRIRRKLQKIGEALKGAFLRIPGLARLSRRLFFARTVIRSAMTILTAFLAFALLTYTIAYPWWVHDAVISLYRQNPSLIAFVIGTNEKLQSLGQALAPIGWMATAINNALLAAAPGFRNSLQEIGASAEPMAELDVTGKYLLVQNLTAWVCALIALAYGRHVSRRRYVKRR